MDSSSILPLEFIFGSDWEQYLLPELVGTSNNNIESVDPEPIGTNMDEQPIPEDLLPPTPATATHDLPVTTMDLNTIHLDHVAPLSSPESDTSESFPTEDEMARVFRVVSHHRRPHRIPGTHQIKRLIIYYCKTYDANGIEKGIWMEAKEMNAYPSAKRAKKAYTRRLRQNGRRI